MKHPPGCNHCYVVRTRPRLRVPPEPRFDAKVRKLPSGCLIWTGAVRGDGYGQFWTGARHVGAHRWAWEVAYGPIPEGQLVLHRCDTPLCVNAEHLFLGSVADNAADMVAKGRASRGEGRLRAANGSWL